MDTDANAEEARRLLDNGYRVILFRDGLGQYSALAVPLSESLSAAFKKWTNYEPPTVTPDDAVFGGPNRMCGCGRSVAEALHNTAEKVFLRQLRPRDDPSG